MLKLHFPAGLTLSFVGPESLPEVLTVERGWQRFTVRHPGPGVTAAFERLQGAGATEQELSECVQAAQGSAILPEWYTQLARLRDQHLVTYTLCHDNRSLLTLQSY